MGLLLQALGDNLNLFLMRYTGEDAPGLLSANATTPPPAALSGKAPKTVFYTLPYFGMVSSTAMAPGQVSRRVAAAAVGGRQTRAGRRAHERRQDGR